MIEENALRFEKMEKAQQELQERLLKVQEESWDQIAKLTKVVMAMS